MPVAVACRTCARRSPRAQRPRPDLGERWLSRLVATAEEDRVSTTIWSGGAAVGLYLGTGVMLAFLVHTHYPGALGLREAVGPPGVLPSPFDGGSITEIMVLLHSLARSCGALSSMQVVDFA